MASAAHMRNLNLVATCVLLFGLTSWPTQAAKPLPGPSRQLLQSPGAAGDLNGFNSFYGDPWGTANGYYDPQGPGYIPGFINVDVSKEYGAHFDFGPVAVDLTQDFAGFTVGNAVGAGYARDGRGYNVQLGGGNIMDLSVNKGSGFGLWLLNGLVNINIGADGRWNVVPSAGAGGFGVKSAGAGAGPVDPNQAVTVQGMQEAVGPAAAMAQAQAQAQAQGQGQGQPGLVDAAQEGAQMDPSQLQAQAAYQQAPAAYQQQPLQAAAAYPPAYAAGAAYPPQQQQQQQLPPAADYGAAAAQLPLPQQQPGARRACEGGVVVRVEDDGAGGQKYVCKYKRGAGPAGGR
ncbi:hypothetical protein MNEG_12504 [Monoraphidium neglectum]|uniref:Uncharacterized protein n=1 Tax=Monoraphidium neglectum TaxID=145388 RepID=A0A0D2J6J6_9CHLO|nr:hypothetical protein MNEG_12504 [Monoraphidium neglectum]KIY95457.1 hypothetical protein MNEG_12504 [Monoraphidium neglectum]|eukprot:XP_013894477.1 hypothetical protein MNEG_12504 [Monoraphidium neglectum]